MTVRWAEGDPHLIPVARELFTEYQRELGVDLSFQSFQDELDGLPGKYGSPGGALAVVEIDGAYAACGAIRDLGDGICEIKRLYVRPEFRRQRLGRILSEILLRRAREFGYEKVRLDSLRRLAAALDLYRSMGFYEIEPYNYSPEPDIVYLERLIGEAPR